MSTELQEYYTYCYDNMEDPNQPNYEYLKDVIKVKRLYSFCCFIFQSDTLKTVQLI